MAGYFSYFPNVYVGEGVRDDEAFKYRLVKNIFRKVRARPDLNQYTTLFESYSIETGETPSMIASRLFDDSFLDWTILLINDIVDVYEEWPKNQNQLVDYVNEKYSGKSDSIHHWETNEIMLDDGITTLVKEGIEVNENWRTIMPDGTVKTAEESIYPVNNYEYEYFKNEVKRQILLPINNMVELMIEEFEDLVAYDPHNELDNANNKKTVMNISSRFLNNTGSVSFASAIASQLTTGGEVTFDDGPSTGFTAGVATSISTTTSTTTSSGASASVTTSTTSSSSGGTSSSSSSSSSSPPSSSSGYGGGY
jgi:hypothetical protein